MSLTRKSSKHLSWQLVYKFWPGYFFIFDADLRVIAASKDVINLLKISEEEIHGKTVPEVYALIDEREEDDLKWRLSLEYMLHTGEQHKMQPRQLNVEDASGIKVKKKIIPVNTPVFQNNELLYIINQLDEVGGESWQQSSFEENLDIISIINDGIYEIDFLRNHVRWNNHLYNILGYAKGEIDLNVAKMLRNVHKEDRRGIRDLIRKKRDAATGFEIEFRLKKKSGEFVDILSKGIIARDKEGEPLRLIASIHDISNYKEQERLKSRLELITGTIPAMVCYVDRELRYQFLNTAYQECYGPDLESLIGKEVREMQDPEIFSDFMVRANKALAGATVEEEVKTIDKNGQERFYKTWLAPDKDKDHIHGFIGMTMEITTEKNREKELKKAQVEKQKLIDELNHIQQQINREKFVLQEFFMEAPSIIAMHEGPEFVIKYLNKKARDIYGNWIGEPIKHITTQPVYHKIIKIFNQVYQKQKKFTARDFKISTALVRGKKMKNSVKRDLYLDIVIQPTHDIDGKTTGIIVYANDVTEVAQAKKALEDNVARSKELLEAMPIIACTYTGEGELEYVNSRWFEYTGQERSSSLHAGFDLALHPQDSFKAEFSWSNALSDGAAYDEYIRLQNHTGDYRWHHHRVVPVKDEDGLLVRWIGTLTDIDDQVKANEKKDEFISIASHELKTPLTSVKAYIELIQELTSQVEEEPVSTYLQKAYRNVYKLQELIAELLDVSRIQSGKIDLKIRSFRADEMVRDVVESYQYSTTSHKIILECLTDVVIHGDRERLEQILNNLLSNAVKYSPEEKEVIVKVYNSVDHLLIDVTDFGIGISSDEKRKLFEQFYRSQNVTKGATGLGMGLYISLAIAKMHGGHITVKSEENKGSTFTLILPLNPDTSKGQKVG